MCALKNTKNNKCKEILSESQPIIHIDDESANDKAEKEKIEKLNAADSQIFQTEKQLKEYGDKISEGNRNNINGALDKLKAAHAQARVRHDQDLAVMQIITDSSCWFSAARCSEPAAHARSA